MINITHSLGWINLILLLILINFPLIVQASIWIIILSIFLWQIMDLDLKGSWISKKIWLRSISSIITFLTVWHRKETHSIFYSALIAFLLMPLNIYISLLDWSSLLWNFLVIFFAIFSHWLLDMANKEPIPLFYFPLINPIWKAKMYTYSNFFNNIFNNFWISTNKWFFNIWLEVSSEKEFKFVTLPLIFLFFALCFLLFEELTIKIFEWSNLIIQHPIIWVLLLIYSSYNNFIFKETWGLPSMIYNILKNQWKFEYRNIKDLKKVFWETNFTKILIFLLVIFSIFFHPQEFLNNFFNSFFQIKEYIEYQIFDSWESFIDKIVKIINYFLF